MTNSEKINWNKIVSESNGKLLFLSEGFKQAAEEWKNFRDEYNNQVQVMAKKELVLNMAMQNLFFELRKYLEKNGHADIYIKDIGFEDTALKEGRFIVSIMDAGQGQIPRR